MWDHSDNCVPAAQEWLVSNHTDNMETKADVILGMMRLSAGRNRDKTVQDRTKASYDHAKTSNNDAPQTEKEKDFAQKEEQEFEREV